MTESSQNDILLIKERFLLGKRCIWLYYNGECCGRVMIKILDHTATIEIFEIYQRFRGQGFSKTFWPRLREYFMNMKINEIHLIAKEDVNRWGKLVKLYQELGFRQDGKEYFNSFKNGSFKMVPMIYKFTDQLT